MRPIRSRCAATALAAALVGWSGFVGPRLPPRAQVLTHAVLALLLVRGTRAPLGLTSPELRRGLRLGLPVAALASAVVAASTALRPVRAAMAHRDLPVLTGEWLLVRIPLGTVWSEEAAFRAALGTVAAEAFGVRGGRLLQAGAFGLSHVADARHAGAPILGTVVVTGVAGWAFGWLYARSGSLAASLLAHLAVNEAGALATLALRRRQWPVIARFSRSYAT